MVLGSAAATLQDVQAFFQSNSNTSMIIHDAIIGDVLQEPTSVLEPVPEVESLPDGFRYKLDLTLLLETAVRAQQGSERSDQSKLRVASRSMLWSKT